MTRSVTAVALLGLLLVISCAGPQRPRPEKPPDQFIVIEGSTYRISWQKVECTTCGSAGNTDRPCAACNGQGLQLMRCFNCAGSGMVTLMGPAGPYVSACAFCGGGGVLSMPCDQCFRTGRARCNLCDGAGYRWEEVRTKLN